MRASTLSLFAVAAALASPAAAGEIDVASKIDAVTVYPDAAVVARVAEFDAPPGDSVLVFHDLPLGLDPASLRIEGAGDSALSIGSVETRVAPVDAKPDDDALAAKIAALREERAALQTTIEAMQAERAMIVRFSQAGPEKLSPEAKPLDVAAWPAAWDAVESALAKVGGGLRPALERARALDGEIAALETQRNSPSPQLARRVVSVALNAALGAHARLTLSYRIVGVGWTPGYDAALVSADNAGEPSLTLTRRAAVSQTTGEDWDDVALTVSTARVARAVAVADLPGQRIDFWQPELTETTSQTNWGRSYASAPAPMQTAATPVAVDAAKAPSAPPPQPVAAQETQAQLQANAYSAEFKAPGRITLASDGSRKSFVLGRVVVQPTLTIETVPGLDPTAYVEAHFVDGEGAPILPGEVALLRDGAFVGEGRIAFVAPGDAADLGFSADDKIKVQRAPVSRKENEPTWFNQNKVETREFLTTVKNLHAFPVKVRIVDRMPVSENVAIGVDLAPSTTPPTEKQVGDKRGVMSWTLDLKPGEAKDVRFAYRLKWPADHEVAVSDAPPAIAAP